MKRQKHPNLYEINTCILLHRLSEKLKKTIKLSAIPSEIWEDLAGQGFQYVWLMGMWQRSPTARQKGWEDPKLQAEYSRILPGWQKKDVFGSPYAVYSYVPQPSFGSWENLGKLKKTLNRLGLGLILDFVPNHMALDQPWVYTHPEYFVPGNLPTDERNKNQFYKVSDKVYLAHGKDPYFPAWGDTVQINYASPEARQAMRKELQKIAAYCDGVRCDMSMLVLNRIFKETWRGCIDERNMPQEEFWPAAIGQVKKQNSDFIFIAEAYWGLEWTLQQQGFDYTYDKRLYDRLIQRVVPDIVGHLRADSAYQEKSVRFIENHDEPRAAASMGLKKSRAAAVIMATIPGLRLFSDGQFSGRRVHLPVQLGREPQEEVVAGIESFYRQLLHFTNDPIFHEGRWELLNFIPAWEGNPSHQDLLGWIWKKEDNDKVVVVNFSNHPSQGRVRLSLGSPEGPSIHFHDHLRKETYPRSTQEINDAGLYVALDAWESHLFSIQESSWNVSRYSLAAH